MPLFGEDPYHWKEQFCTGCRQVTWHYDGLCSNAAFHKSATDYSIEQIAPDQVVAPQVGTAAPAPEAAPPESQKGHESEQSTATLV